MGLAFSAETEDFIEWAALFFWRNHDLISSVLKSGKPLVAEHLFPEALPLTLVLNRF